MGLARLLIPKYIGRHAPPTLRTLHRLVAIGIAAAVAMLFVTAAVLEGFWGSYVSAARRFHGDVIIMQDSGGPRPERLLEALHQDTETAPIEAESPFELREGLLTGGGGVTGVIVKAIDWDDFAKVHPELRVNWEGAGAAAFASDTDGLPVILGKSLVGESLPTRLFMPTPAHKEGDSIPVTVVGVFDSGLYDYDHQFIFVPKPRFDALLQLDDRTVDGVELRLVNPKATWRATQIWQAQFPEATITNWSELNHNMFEALRLQRTTFVVLMSLFVIIAVSNLVSVVGLQVYFRRRDGAVLRILGLSLRRTRRLIALATSWTALVGITIGSVAGLLLITICAKTSLITLPESVYFVSHLPLELPLTWVAGIIVGSLAMAALVVTVAVRRMAQIPILKGLL